MEIQHTRRILPFFLKFKVLIRIFGVFFWFFWFFFIRITRNIISAFAQLLNFPLRLKANIENYKYITIVSVA